MTKMEDKKVLYVTTKNIDYIRNIQIVRLLKSMYKKVDIIYSKHKNYYLRIIDVNLKLMLTNRKKYDIIFFGFLPQLILSFLYNKKLKEQIIEIDFIISLYNTLVLDRKKVKENTFLAKILKKTDKKIASKADVVYTDTKVQALNFENEIDIKKEKFKVLYLEANTKIYNKEVEKIKLGEDTDFIILWFGSVLPLQGVDIIIKAAKELEHNPKIKFYIIGNIKKIKNNKNNCKNIKFIEWLPDNMLAKYINSADVCLAGHFALKNQRADREIPGKAFIYNAMGKKMILGESKANREIFEEDNKRIYYVERGNPGELAKKIERIYEQK